MVKDLKILLYPTPAFLNRLCTESFATEMAATYHARDFTRFFQDCQENSNIDRNYYRHFFGNLENNDSVCIDVWFLYIQIFLQHPFVPPPSSRLLKISMRCDRKASWDPVCRGGVKIFCGLSWKSWNFFEKSLSSRFEIDTFRLAASPVQLRLWWPFKLAAQDLKDFPSTFYNISRNKMKWKLK